MTILTYTRGSLQRAASPPARRDTGAAGSARAHLATIGRFCLSVLTVVVAGGLLVAIMALKVIVYLPHFHYH